MSTARPHLTILTGASRGLGLALATQLLEQGHHLLCLARQPATSLQTVADQHGALLEQWSVDLADASGVSQRLADWLQVLGAQGTQGQPATATLINNAGVIAPLVPVREAQGEDLAYALRVGLEAPIHLTAAFLRSTSGWIHCRRKVLNVSSGLGRRAMASGSSYCAAKAGMDHFTRCIALEEAALAHGARVCSLAPGVIDTDMQVQLRGADPAQFPDRDNFAALQSRGQLTGATEAAQRLLRYLDREDFGAEPVADVRGN